MFFKKTLLLACSFAIAGFSAQGEAGVKEVSDGSMKVTAAEDKGEIFGFDLAVSGKIIAPVRLSSNGFITASKAETKEEGKTKTLTLSGLKGKPGTGVKFDPSDFVSVTITQGELYPVVRFKITIAEFSEDAWKAGAEGCTTSILLIGTPPPEG